MKIIITNPEHQTGETRIRSWFAFLPVIIKRELRWLENITVQQKYVIPWKADSEEHLFRNRGKWVNIKYMSEFYNDKKHMLSDINNTEFSEEDMHVYVFESLLRMHSLNFTEFENSNNINKDISWEQVEFFYHENFATIQRVAAEFKKNFKKDFSEEQIYVGCFLYLFNVASPLPNPEIRDLNVMSDGYEEILFRFKCSVYRYLDRNKELTKKFYAGRESRPQSNY